MDSRRVFRQAPANVEVKIFTADNIEQHLANGWTFEQLVSQKVSVLGGRDFSVTVNGNENIGHLRNMIEDIHGFSRSAFTLLNGKRIVTNDEPIWCNKQLLLMSDHKKVEGTKKPSQVPPGSLMLKDPRQFGGSQTMTVSPEEEKQSKNNNRNKPEVDRPVRQSASSDRTPNRSDILSAIRKRSGATSSRPAASNRYY
eukprot:TRINITY_DN31327_c0_g1_i1.p1 TRINITY_DN31327_c0_g1~~TRINITY_DN31327_c0_g1_i1.p1  ORF type:complete len:198 (+),score=33.16 TRINITY_DN31327_c0_g1_i1:98-691(+)